MPKFYGLEKRLTGWVLFILLCFIWGSSFILMKAGLKALNPYQVASLRILSAGLVLLPFARKAWKAVKKKDVFYIITAGLLGSFFPAYLFCIAETRIDSSLTGIINSLTPLFTIIIGALFFHYKTSAKKITGVAVGFAGLLLLPFAAKKGVDLKDISYSLLVLLATVSYADNINIVARFLHHVGSFNMAALSLAFLIIPGFAVLFATGYFNLSFSDPQIIYSTLASAVLGIFGTAIATVLFYMLVKKRGAVFASLVTYGIPFIAVLWGLASGEIVTLAELGCMGIILAGVYIANRQQQELK